MDRIIDRDCPRVAENGCRLIERHSMPSEVSLCFFRIPFKLHDSRLTRIIADEAPHWLVDGSARGAYTARMVSEASLLAALRRYWGYDSFLPLQESIVRSLLAGRDTCVVMPTGGGKSLCYQLPAAVLPRRTVVVVSPLIALMQDQVAQLTHMGIASAALNSSLSEAEQAQVMRRAAEGGYRLLYLSPERLAREDTVGWLERVPVTLFAIDEAHCISEWGHEFRPEYRQLSRLRAHFPQRPLAAFTASATRRVRHDIIAQLQLRDPHKYIASFHRPNLRYLVRECDGSTQRSLLLRALRRHSGSNIIVYAPTIATVERTVALLEEQSIAATAYHGQMDAATRRGNQERWMSDEVRVLVGTIAFGLGINKPAVRAVIHLSLPKSIEQYYQEAGRAGRDGLSADCLLLWRKRDAGLLAHFAGEIKDPEEQERAWQRYHDIRGFVESRSCRHRQICLHFGETPKWKACGACDVCGCDTAWLDVPEETPQPRRSKSKRPAAAAAAQPVAPASPASPVAASPAARLRPSLAGQPELVTETGWRAAASDANAELREYLREWRRTMAKEQGVPAYIVMHDTSLEELCRVRPRSLAELLRVYGFGQRKVAAYGRQILDTLAQFEKGARAAALPQSRSRATSEPRP